MYNRLRVLGLLFLLGTVFYQFAWAEEPPTNFTKVPADIACSIDQIGVQFGSGPMVRVKCWPVSNGSGAAKDIALADETMRKDGSRFILKTKDYGKWYITGDEHTLTILMDPLNLKPMMEFVGVHVRDESECRDECKRMIKNRELKKGTTVDQCMKAFCK